MSKRVTEDLFKFAGRRNRKSYLFFVLAAIAAQIVAGLVVVVLGFGGEMLGTVGLAIYAVVSIVLFVASLAVGSQRCRDFGWTGWAMLLLLVPVIGIIFALAIIFIPGSVGDNRYGADPLQQVA